MDADLALTTSPQTLGVVPVLIGPMQVLITFLPAILVAIGTMIIRMLAPSALWRGAQLLWSQKFIVLPIAAVIAGGIWAYHEFVPDSMAAVNDQAASLTDWPAYRGSMGRTGYVPSANQEDHDPAHGGVNWSFTDGAIKSFYCSPAVVGNRVFATSSRWEFIKKDGSIVCLDAETGAVAWKFNEDGYRATYSSPVVAKVKGADDKERTYLAVGEGLHLTSDARVFCLDVDASNQQRKGVKLWEYRTNSHVESSPCIADGKVFIGAGDDGFYCFALEPNPDGSANLLWHKPGGKVAKDDPPDKEYPNQWLDCETSPVYHDGRVYFGMGLGGKAVVCLNAETGEELWRCKTPYPAFGAPAVTPDGQMIVAGMGNGDMINVHPQPAGEVWGIDLNGKPLWKFKASETILGTIAIDAPFGNNPDKGYYAYFGSRDNYLYCVNTKDGSLVRKWDARAPIVTSPAVGKEYVYVVTASGELYALDKLRLSPVWSFSLGSTSMSSPTVANGHVYVGTDTDGLKCVGLRGPEKAKPIAIGALGGAGQSNWDGYPAPKDAKKDCEEVWAFDDALPGATDTAQPPQAAGAVTYLNGSLFVGLRQGAVQGLARLDFPLGQETDPAVPLPPILAEKPKLRWLCATKNEIVLPVAVTETLPPPAKTPTDPEAKAALDLERATPQDKFPDAIYMVDGKSGDKARALRCLEPATGQVRWERPVADTASGEFQFWLRTMEVRDDKGNVTFPPAYDRLLIADRSDGLTMLDVGEASAAKEVWTFKGGACVGVPLVNSGVVVTAVESPAKVVALDAETGVVLWERALPHTPSTGPVRVEDTVWVGLGEKGVLPIRLYDGQLGQAIGCGASVTGRMLTNSELLIVPTADGKLNIIDFVEKDEETGRSLPTRRKPVENVVPGIFPVLTFDAMVYVVREKNDNTIRLFDFPTQRQLEAEALKAKQAAADGKKTSPTAGEKKDPILRIARLQNKVGSKLVYGQVAPAPLGLLRSGVLVATEQKGLVYLELTKD
jgi:outer membrane protein assembly factor BamB